MEHGLILATRYPGAFKAGRVKLVNPWAYTPEGGRGGWRLAAGGEGRATLAQKPVRQGMIMGQDGGMDRKRSILIVGGGTAGWMTAAYLAKFLELSGNERLEIRLLESPEIGIIGVGEGTFPTIRNTLAVHRHRREPVHPRDLRHLQTGHPLRRLGAYAEGGEHSHFFHPFEAPFHVEGVSLVPYWLLQDEKTRRPFAEAMTIQNRVAEAQRGPKGPGEGDFSGPLSYAYHFDATMLANILAERARELGVVHLQGLLNHVEIDATGAIDHVVTAEQGGSTPTSISTAPVSGRS